MKHFQGGGCLKGEDHNGSCEWGEEAHRREVLSSDSDEAREHLPPSTGGNVPGDEHESGEDVPGVSRQARWKARNRDKVRAYQREFMRRKRAEERK